jgi:hypothetical protein
MHEHPDLLQTVGRYYHPIEAEIARGLLESEGFNPFLHSINHAWANWLYCMALGGIRLQVPYWEMEDALKILSLPEEHYSADDCEICGSSDTKLAKARWLVSFLVFHFAGIPLPGGIEDRICCQCGSRWKER